MTSSLRIAAFTDELTGLYNRRGYVTRAASLLKLADPKTIWQIFFDVDELKLINDTFGHWAGDRALMELAGVLRQAFRSTDIVARVGGDEFAVLAIAPADAAPESWAARWRDPLAELFEKVFELKQDPAVLYDAAQSHRLAGNKQKALVLYQNYLRMFGERQNRTVVEKRIAELKVAIEAEKVASTNPPTELFRDKPELLSVTRGLARHVDVKVDPSSCTRRRRRVPAQRAARLLGMTTLFSRSTTVERELEWHLRRHTDTATGRLGGHEPVAREHVEHGAGELFMA